MTKAYLIAWDKAYEVGVDTIDRQHKVLVDYINQLAWAIDNQQEQAIIPSLFAKLIAYTKYHFEAEEAYFYKLNKNDCLLHQLQHKHFMEELENIATRINAKNTQLKDSTESSSAMELLYFLTDWLLHHIQIEDKKYLQQQEKP
ncbi:hemerythrin [Colwellia chukchiensis]|uniref:Hemerythrin n=1 Tax=Colwellia chukchiensis TaxID=641665 RepID=A0A1H7RV44_9GAMM|nr:bacteriohemerythrin [Colwellia chukchiensis]SEL64092.1 hemerythrin [Colwellia chukchiensis]